MLLQVDGGSEVLAGVDGVAAEFLFDAENLVELGKTLGSRGRTSFLAALAACTTTFLTNKTHNLSSAEPDNNIGNGDIFGLSRAVGDHHSPSSAESILCGLDGLGNCADLVHLKEERIARLQLNGLLDEFGIGDGQIVTSASLASSTLWGYFSTYPTIWKSEVLKK